MSKKRLGRGLDALLSADRAASEPVPTENAPAGSPGAAADASSAAGLLEVAINDVVRSRYQPRQQFDEGALNELAASISTQGLMQPVVLRSRPQGGYELIAGERRWRAAQIAGLSRIPAVVREVSDEQASAMALIENIQREDLNPLEEAQALERLKEEFGLTQQQVADAVGKSRVAVTNLLRLLNLCAPVRAMLLAGEVEMGHARALLPLPALDQERLARVVAAKGLSVRATESLVRDRQQPAARAARRPVAEKDADTARLERELSDRVGAPVSINQAKAGGGSLVISYSNLDELEGILSHLK
ncbi:MAG: ParB/RepB/Spo0J family partition protein [Pseudomonadota bacterium]